jgi:peptidoglycan LD-endopeptidase CwlK
MSTPNVIADWDLLHPKAKPKFTELRDGLRKAFQSRHTPTLFEPFETYRTPLRQNLVLAMGASKASAYSSPHQFGLAVDFVPRNGGRWSWDLAHDWDFLRAAARELGLRNEIQWDRAHVEHPTWGAVKDAMRF